MPYGAVEWAREANTLQKQAGKPLTKEALNKKLGKPTGKVTRKTSLAKGGKWGPRTGDRQGQTARRGSNLKRASGDLTPEDKRFKRNMEARHRTANKKITDPQKKLTVGHKEPAWKSGEQHKRLEETHGTEHADEILEKVRKSRQAVGGGLGDQKENLGTETEEENNTAREEYEGYERHLGEMEERNPSNPDNPSALYSRGITLQDVGFIGPVAPQAVQQVNGNGNGNGNVNGAGSYVNGNGNGNGNGYDPFTPLKQAASVVDTAGDITRNMIIGGAALGISLLTLGQAELPTSILP